MLKNNRHTLKITTPFKRFVSAAKRGDSEAMKAMVSSGFDVNEMDVSGASVLASVMYFFSEEQECLGSAATAHLYDVIKLLLSFGADPNGHACQTHGPLLFAAICMDCEMIVLLLDAGADVNATCILRGVLHTVYDVADSAYRNSMWSDSTEVDDDQYRGDEDERLLRLDRAALRLERIRPWHLRLLRERGALSYREIF